MDQEVSINIFGSCVTRDIFRYKWNDRIDVNKYISRVTIMSSIAEYLPYESDEVISNMFESEYLRRMMRNNLDKKVFRVLQDPADYFLIDLIDERLPMIEIEKDGRKTIIVNVFPNKSEKQYLKLLYGNCEVRRIRRDKLPDDIIEDSVKKYCERVKECSDPNKIILHKAYMVKEYVDEDKSIKTFKDSTVAYINWLNQDINKKYKLIEKYIPECKSIEITKEVYADINHIWGLAPMHYTDSYYQQVYAKLIELINNK